MKGKMNRKAQDAYVYECGYKEGLKLALQEEMQKGREEGRR